MAGGPIALRDQRKKLLNTDFYTINPTERTKVDVCEQSPRRFESLENELRSARQTDLSAVRTFATGHCKKRHPDEEEGQSPER